MPGVTVSSAEIGDDSKVSVKLSNGEEVSYGSAQINT